MVDPVDGRRRHGGRGRRALEGKLQVQACNSSIPPLFGGGGCSGGLNGVETGRVGVNCGDKGCVAAARGSMNCGYI